MSPDTPSTQFQLGENKAAIGFLVRSQGRTEKDIADIKETLADIQNTLAEKKGERRVTTYIASGIGAAAMFILTIIARKLGFAS